jgi:hypothetical protein
MSGIKPAGLGGINSVTYTDLDGLHLSDDQITNTTTKVTTASSISNQLQTAINTALYDNLKSASLSQIFNDSTNPTLTDVLSFLQSSVNVSITPNQALSIEDFKTLKKALDNYGNLEASKLPGSQGGGIKSVNGNFYVNGQEVTIQDVFMAVRVNQLANFEDQINAYMNELQRNNNASKAANQWISMLNEISPSDTSSQINTASFLALQESFASQFGFDPVARFMPTSAKTGANSTTSVGGKTYDLLADANSTKITAYVTDAKNYVTNINSENQTAQTYLDQLNNKRSEVLDSITNFTKSEGQVQSDMANKL